MITDFVQKEVAWRSTLKEVSLSRIWQHIGSDYPSAALSAFDPSRSPEENEKAARALETEVRGRHKLGFVWLLGKYVYDDGTSIDEISMFVPGVKHTDESFSKLILRVAKKFDQESVLFIPSEETDAYFYYTDGRKSKVGSFHPNKVSQWMSRLLKKSDRGFVFEGAYAPKNYLERWANSVASENGRKT